MHVHQEIVPDIEKVIDHFAVANRRRNLLYFLLVFNQYIIFALKVLICFYFSHILALINCSSYFNETATHFD